MRPTAPGPAVPRSSATPADRPRGGAEGRTTALEALARTAAQRILGWFARGGEVEDLPSEPTAAPREPGARVRELERIVGAEVLLSGEASSRAVDVLIRTAETRHGHCRLWVWAGRDLVAFDLVQGAVVCAHDAVRAAIGERVGEILIGLGALDPARLDRALELADILKVPLGNVLLEQRLVTADQLADALRQQCVLRLSRVLFAQGVVYALTGLDAASIQGELNVRIDPHELLALSGIGRP